MRRRGSLRDKRQLEVVDDAVHHGIVGEEGDDLHLATVLGADHRVNLIDFADHLGPALGRDRPELLLHNQERDSGLTCLPDLPPMRISVEAIISHRDLALVRDMGSRPGDELQVVHPLHLFGVFPIAVADLAFSFIEGEPPQGQERPDHVFAHALGPFLSLSTHPAVDIEPRVPKGVKAFRPFGAQQLLVDKRGQDLVGEELSQPRVVDACDLMEEAGRVHSVLGHQEMQMRVDIYPVPKCLNGRNHSGRSNGTTPDKGQSARDVGDDTLPPWREQGLKKRAKAREMRTSP